MPVKIAAFTDHLYTPSSRFRIRSHIPFLSRHNISVTDLYRKFSTETAGRLFPNRRIRHSPLKLLTSLAFESLNIADTLSRSLKSNHYDASWISRELIIGYPSFEHILKKPLFFDIDDAVFLSRSSQPGIHCLMRNATAIFAGNMFLADYCSNFNSSVYIIPTAVDVDRFAPSINKRVTKQMMIGWSGTSSSYKYFLPIADAISKFLTGKPDVRLKFFSDRFPYELKQLHPYLDFEYWAPNLEAEQIRSLDIGLMPIDNSEWARGKCAYKMLLYASTGLPTICSSVGINKQLISQYNIGLSAQSPSDWYDSLEFCYRNRHCLQSIFPNCRSTVVTHFSRAVIQEKLLRIFRAQGFSNQ
jgi:glycosyltransferase involved in cell wall biosynthesis